AFRWLPEHDANVELSEDPGAFTLTPGRAFWVVSRDAHRIDTAPVPGVSTSALQPKRILLAPGWNPIGDPFAFPVAWSDVGKSAGVSDPVAFDSDRNDYADDSPRVLMPFAGYFVENTSAVIETLSVQPIASDSTALGAPPVPESRAATGEIAFRLEARTADG